jgi:predicted methyltransferase
MRTNLMRSLAIAAIASTAMGAASCQATGGASGGSASVTPTSAHIVAAIADPARPQDAAATAGCLERTPALACTGVKLDPYRKPAEMLAFAEVAPGDKVGELIPGGGYLTRVFSKAVGPTGKVYLFNGPPPATGALGFQPILDDKTNYANTSYIQTDFKTIPAPEPLDLVWTSQNYHDLHNPGRNIDIVAANKAVFNALKPGGVYVVLDHQSAKGVEFSADLHRIDKEKVKAEVLAAGFQYVGESTVLVNAADDGTKMVFDPSVRRNTNQFILKFKRPA